MSDANPKDEDGKPKFVPKERAPYLMQQEVIKEKESQDNLEAHPLTTSKPGAELIRLKKERDEKLIKKYLENVPERFHNLTDEELSEKIKFLESIVYSDQLSDEASIKLQIHFKRLIARLKPKHKNSIKLDHRDNERGNIEVTNEVTNEVTSKEHRGNERGNHRDNERGNDQGNERDNERGNERGNKSADIVKATLMGLSKNHRIVFDYFLQKCKDRGDTSTGPIFMDIASFDLSIDIGVLRTTINRLITNKGLMSRLKGKGCRGGFSIFKIAQIVQDCDHNLNRFSYHRGNERGNHRDNERGNDQGNERGNIGSTSSISSSNKLLLNTKYLSSNNDQISNEDRINWVKEIDMKSLHGIAGGLTEDHLRQIIAIQHFSKEVIQESIYRCAHQIKTQKKKVENIGAYFISTMKRCDQNGWPITEGYKTPEMIKIDDENRLNEQREKAKKQMEENIFKFGFDRWEKTLSNEEKESIYTPEAIEQSRKFKIIAPKISCLKTFYRENMFENEYEEIRKILY